MGQIVAYTGSTTVFFVSAPIFMALPAAIIPIFLGAMARLDPLGGLAAAHQAFLMVGGALAAFTGGVLSDLGGYQLNGLGVAVFVVVGVVLAQPGLARADHLRHAPV
jgi:predicted MFS family arabinose efflux permease